MEKEKYGFVYIWLDRKRNKHYIGCHWGDVNDGYICSSTIMRNAYRRRPEDFKRRILSIIKTSRIELLELEHKWLSLIKDEELKIKYYNISKKHFGHWSSKSNDPAKKSGESRRGKSPNNDPQMLIERGKKISAKVKGRKFSPEHREKLRQAKLGKKHSPETIAKRTSALVETWNNGKRKRAEPKNTMTIEEQGRLHSENLKKRWADPVWAENQKQRLREGSKRRHQTVI
jgi:hypothetical protein